MFVPETLPKLDYHALLGLDYAARRHGIEYGFELVGGQLQQPVDAVDENLLNIEIGGEHALQKPDKLVLALDVVLVLRRVRKGHRARAGRVRRIFAATARLNNIFVNK